MDLIPALGVELGGVLIMGFNDCVWQLTIKTTLKQISIRREKGIDIDIAIYPISLIITVPHNGFELSGRKTPDRYLFTPLTSYKFVSKSRRIPGPFQREFTCGDPRLHGLVDLSPTEPVRMPRILLHPQYPRVVQSCQEVC